MTPLRILIADDHALVRMGLTALLETEDDMTIVGTAKNGEEAVREATRLRPDVALIDLMMPKMDGARATAEILRASPNTRVIVITSFAEADALAHAIDAGAAGVVMKDTENASLVRTIRKVHAGERVIPAEIQRQLAAEPPVPQLSPRQLAVLQSLTRGLTNRDIAQQLGITEGSVEEHVATLLTKIGAANRTEAVARALQKQLLKY